MCLHQIKMLSLLCLHTVSVRVRRRQQIWYKKKKAEKNKKLVISTSGFSVNFLQGPIILIKMRKGQMLKNRPTPPSRIMNVGSVGVQI